MKFFTSICLTGIFFAINAQSFAQSRMNIVYIFTDQQTSSAMSCTGNPYVSTPNMDKLAENGIRFTNAYCSFPLCTPSRASMMTGLSVSRTGVIDNNYSLSDELKSVSMGVLFSNAGYECVYAGKWHLPDYNIDDTHGFKKLSDFGDDKVADSCVKFLNQPHHKPFLLVASLDNPHNICEFARGQDLPWGNISIPVQTENLPNVPANFCIPPYEPGIVREEQSARPPVYPGKNFDTEQWRKYIYAYYRLVEKVDIEVGKIVDAIQANSLQENTLIIFASDHGDGLSAHQWNQKTVLYENAVKVPFIVVPPKGVKGVSIPLPVNAGTDLLPTMTDYAGINSSAEFDGISLKPVCDHPEKYIDSKTSDRYIFTETNFKTIKGEATDGFMIRQGDFKYIAYELNDGNRQEQLFNLNDDPGEMVNLAVVNQYKDTLLKFRKLLLEAKSKYL